MPLIFNGQVIAGDPRPVLEKLDENSDYLVTSKGIANYVKNNFSKTVPDALSTDGINYTVSIPEITKLYNGLEITVIPKLDSTSKQAYLSLNNFGKIKIAPTSPSSNNTILEPTYSNYIKGNAPLKLIYNQRMNNWMTCSVIAVPVEMVIGYEELLARIEALEAAIGR